METSIPIPIPTRLDQLAAYTPIEPFEVLSARLGIPVEQLVKLDANENPYGPSPKARAALADLAFAHIYPDPESRSLRAALAQFTGAPVENLLAGAGADELIDLVLRALLEPGDRVLVCPPTFGMYALDTRLNAGQVIAVPRRADFSLDLQAVFRAVAQHRPKVLFLATPNNPDGAMPSAVELDALLDLPLLVVLDEAYIEFTGAGGRLGEQLSRIRQAGRCDNLVVLRTFSKWAGLAGLRVGYGAFPSWLMPTLWKIKPPYNVNVAATQAALASLDDLDVLAGNVARIRAERERLFSRLQALEGLDPFPSQTNFILCRVRRGTAEELKARLAVKGILVRYFSNPETSDCLRISVGRPADSDRVMEVLEEVI